MMFQINNTVLLVIDIQGKLASLIHEKEKIYTNVATLIKAARILSIPIIVTEQAPKKIGETIPAIAQSLGNYEVISKMSFSCWGSAEFQRQLTALQRKQILITGIETHVCVYQTVNDLLSAGFEVNVIVDAVSSRSLENKQIALERMKVLGAGLVSTEMIATELIRTAKHEKFKEILALIK